MTDAAECEHIWVWDMNAADRRSKCTKCPATRPRQEESSVGDRTRTYLDYAMPLPTAPRRPPE